VFVPLVEQMGLMAELGRSVLRQALAQRAAWEATAPHLVVHVNVSPLQLAYLDFPREVLADLRDAGVSPSCLVLEVTEGALSGEAPEALAALNALRDAGVRIAVDDFGTGWSSLARLRQLPVDVVKVDRQFTASLADRGGSAVVDAVLRLAAALSLEVVAEGVEEPSQLAALGKMGCTSVQGYLLGRPVSAEHLALGAPAVPVPRPPAVESARKILPLL
jgi:EAL domain-containing protein (putative c-di-GMP-specific phosphodiesterase class I)